VKSSQVIYLLHFCIWSAKVNQRLSADNSQAIDRSIVELILSYSSNAGETQVGNCSDRPRQSIKLRKWKRNLLGSFATEAVAMKLPQIKFTWATYVHI